MMTLLEALPTVIGTAAVAPALLLLWLVIAAEERPGPPAQVWTAFLLGAATISLLGLARAPFAAMVAAPDNPWTALVMHSVFGVALPEEAVKVIAIVLVSSTKRRALTNPMDTVVYGAAVGLGFAALRSVLTVPFHGALGIIAGAYLTLARAGTALGAHRHHRDWARFSSRLLILMGPLALHSAFDFPLLALQRLPDLDPTLRMWLGGASLLIGFSSIGFAMRLVRRVARHHSPRTEIGRERLSQLRRMWALLVVGGGVGFVGLAFVLTSVHHWLVNPDRNVTLVLIPIGLTSILLGVALLVVTTAIYVLGRNRIRTSGEGFSSAHGGG